MLILWIHVLAAGTLIGALIFQYFVFRPALRAASPEGTGFVKTVERRFKTLRWVSLLLLLGTGTLNLLSEGGSPRIESAYGGVLMLKLFLVLVVFAMMGLYDYMAGEAKARIPASQPEPGEATGGSYTPRTGVGLTILFLTMGIIYLAMYLSRM